jgi:hypothetical protein
MSEWEGVSGRNVMMKLMVVVRLFLLGYLPFMVSEIDIDLVYSGQRDEAEECTVPHNKSSSTWQS